MAAQLVEARFNEVNARLSARVQEITETTGISFSHLFAQLTANQTTESTSSSTASSGLGSAIIGLLGLGSDSDSSSLSGSLSDITSLLGVENVTATDQLLALLTRLGEGIKVGSSGTTDSTRAAYREIVNTVAERYGIHPALLDAVVQAESDYDAECVSTAGAVGLMQLMPNTAAGLGVTDSYDPEQNVDGGARYLLTQIIRYNGDVKTALAAYNCGPTGLSKRGVDNVHDPEQFAKLPLETQTYLNNIQRILTENGYPNLLNANFYS